VNKRLYRKTVRWALFAINLAYIITGFCIPQFGARGSLAADVHRNMVAPLIALLFLHVLPSFQRALKRRRKRVEH